MEWKPTHGRILPTPADVLQAAADYAVIFLRIQGEWLAALVGIVDRDANDRSEPPEDQPPAE